MSRRTSHLYIAYTRTCSFWISTVSPHRRGLALHHRATMSLPKPSSQSAYVEVTIISAGSLDMPEYFINKDAPEDSITLPDYAFLIEHKGLGKKVFFDVGIAKV
jgi:hypothetical protein